MSYGMIVRRGGGGGGGGFDPNGAVLKVVTSTGCTVLVTGTGYSKTHQQADGFPRSGDANVTEHFFSIPTSAFGTITVKATNTYGDNTKTVTVNTAGKAYEVLCGGINIILNSTFGLQEGFSVSSTYYGYSERYKTIYVTGSATSGTGSLVPAVTVTPYEHLTVSLSAGSDKTASFYLRDVDQVDLATIQTTSNTVVQISADITNKYYTTANLILYTGISLITEIVLS